MNKSWIIAKRELGSFFDSLIAYVIITLFLGLSGFFTWLFGNTVFLIGQANLSVFFGIAYWSLFFFIPALTMKMLAEENRSGTIELLSTKAVSDWQIVFGKFLACLILVIIALLFTLPYYFTVIRLGSVDHGGVIGGYFGLILLSGAYIAIGIFASSVTSNQIVAYLLSLFIAIFFQIVFQVMSSTFLGPVGKVLDYLSMTTHFESMSRGVIDSRDLIYFLSIIGIGLLFSQAMLSKRNWQS